MATLIRVGRTIVHSTKEEQDCTLLNSLTAMWRQDAAFFNELRARVITPRIFGRF